MNLKRQVYLMLPKPLQKKTKDFYYGKWIDSLYRLKYKKHYGLNDFFDTIALETTTYCNLRCSFCPNSNHERGLQKNEKQMDKEVFMKIIDELAEIEYRGKVALYSYGEPCTDNRLPELIQYAKQKLPNSFVEINSNGFLLTVELYQTLVRAGIDKIYVSQYTDKMPSSVVKVYEFLKENPEFPDRIQYRIFNAETYPLLSNRGGEIEMEQSVNYERPICGYPHHAQTIDWEGNWVLCCNDYHSSIKFGNLGKETIMQVWNKPYFKKIREDTNNGIYDLEICKVCVGHKPMKKNQDLENNSLVTIRSSLPNSE